MLFLFQPQIVLLMSPLELSSRALSLLSRRVSLSDVSLDDRQDPPPHTHTFKSISARRRLRLGSRSLCGVSIVLPLYLRFLIGPRPHVPFLGDLVLALDSSSPVGQRKMTLSFPVFFPNRFSRQVFANSSASCSKWRCYWASRSMRVSPSRSSARHRKTNRSVSFRRQNQPNGAIRSSIK